jgi:hypothetical protein
LRIVGVAHKAVGLAIYARKRPDQTVGALHAIVHSGVLTAATHRSSIKGRSRPVTRRAAYRQWENVLITGGARYVGHVLSPRWGAGVRPIDCSRHVLPALPPEFADGPLRSCDRRSRADPIALVSGEGTFQSSLLCRCARRTATLVMVIASRRAQRPDSESEPLAAFVDGSHTR